MWRIWMVLRSTPVKYIYIYIYIYVLFVVYINYLFIFSMLKNLIVLNGIVEITSVCLMPMEEDPSIVVLDDDE